MRLRSNRRKSARPNLEALETRLTPAANFSLQYANYNTKEDWGYKSLTVVREGDNSSAMSVDVTAVAGSAQPGQDYQPLQTTLNFAPGEATKDVKLYLVNDSVYEQPEALTVELSNPVGDGAGLGTTPTATVNIADDEPAPGSGASFRFYYNTWNTQENWGYKSITVVRDGDNSSAMSVDLATVAGSAQPGQDYQPLQTTLNFAPGEKSKSVNLHVINDTMIESVESLSVVLSNPVGDNVSLGSPHTAAVNITSDDAAFSFFYNHFDTQEGWGYTTVYVVRAGYTGTTMTVQLATSAGSAQPGQDYQALNQTLTFGPGETTKSSNLYVIDDSIVEGPETLSVALSNPQGAVLGAVSSAIVNIADNDIASPGTLQFSYATFTTNEGWGYAILYVSRSGGSVGQVSVDYQFLDGTAVNGSDYNASNGSLTFGDGETSKTILVSLIDDAFIEMAESLSVKLSNPTGGATLGALDLAVLNIQDNDA